MARGIDIHPIYQQVTDWERVARTANYVWVKVSDGGAPYRKAWPDSHVNGAKRAGVPVGGYHYAQPGDPQAQADVFLAELKRLAAFGLVPMLDLEAPFSPNSTARDFGVRFCKRIAAKGYRPGVYMSDSFARNLRPDRWGISGLVIWIARYGSKPAYGGRYDLHQYSSDGSVPGITGRVDMNESYTNAHLMEGADDVSAKELWTYREHEGDADAIDYVRSSFNLLKAIADDEGKLTALIKAQADVIAARVVAKLPAGAVEAAVVKQAVKDALREGVE